MIQGDSVRSKYFYGYNIVAAGFAIQGISIGALFAYGVFFKEFQAEFGWSRATISGASSLAFFIMGAAGILAGAVAAPVLLPWIPGRAFAVKGTLTGIVAGLVVVLIFKNSVNWVESTALLLMTVAISSYLAMNFTGSTPFTSPSGVEKEMRKAIPFQALALLAAIVAWVGAAFAG